MQIYPILAPRYFASFANSFLRRNWGGEFENVAILVAIAVNEDGYCEVLGAAEGMKAVSYTHLFIFTDVFLIFTGQTS